MNMIDQLSTIIVAVALIHSFLTPALVQFSKKFEKDSAGEVFFHLLSEVEIVFGFWAFIFLIYSH